MRGFSVNTNSYLFSLVIFAPVLGHAAGVFNRFHGGKCIAVSFGVMFGLIPVTYWGIILLAALYILFSLVKLSSNRIRSIIVYSLFLLTSAIIMNVFGYHTAAVGCGLISLTAIAKHITPARAAQYERNDIKLTELSRNDK